MGENLFTEVMAQRTMNTLYIWIDVLFLCLLFGILMMTKRYQAIIAGLIGGLLYFLVDYGIFYMLLGTREVNGADPFLFLLWLSISYGFTNFAWIWLWLDRDGHSLEWSLLIVSGWFCTGLLSQSFGSGFHEIAISRGTTQYHGIMALLLFLGYTLLCVYNIRCRDRSKKAPLLWILAIGILVQFGWEFMLRITGIRNPSLDTIIVNSLLETNMGLPYLYLIHKAVNKFFCEDLSRRTALRPVLVSATEETGEEEGGMA